MLAPLHWLAVRAHLLHLLLQPLHRGLQLLQHGALQLRRRAGGHRPLHLRALVGEGVQRRQDPGVALGARGRHLLLPLQVLLVQVRRQERGRDVRVQVQLDADRLDELLRGGMARRARGGRRRGRSRAAGAGIAVPTLSSCGRSSASFRISLEAELQSRVSLASAPGCPASLPTRYRAAPRQL